MLLLPGWDASPSHGSGYLGLYQIDLSCSYRILHGKSVCIVFMHQLVVTEIELHFFIHLESAQFNYLNTGLISQYSQIFLLIQHFAKFSTQRLLCLSFSSYLIGYFKQPLKSNGWFCFNVSFSSPARTYNFEQTMCTSCMNCTAEGQSDCSELLILKWM